MKRTISVTLGGRLFNIEDDAYEQLKKYLDDLRQHFSHEQGEIVADIESNIADKFADKISPAKQAIDLADVKELIAVMGTVTDLDEELPQNKEEKVNSSVNQKEFSKKLYRDVDNRVIGGVSAGLGVYFGVDPLIFRVIFLILVVVGGSGILIYLLLWLLMPAARTSAQKLEMAGDPLTIESLRDLAKQNIPSNEELRQSANRFSSRITAGLRSLVDLIGRGLRSLGSIFRWAFGLGALLVALGLAVAFSVALFTGFFNLNNPYFTQDLPIAELIGYGPVRWLLLALYSAVIIPLALVIMGAVGILRRKIKFNWPVLAITFILWLVALVGVSSLVFHYRPVVTDYLNDPKNQPVIERELPVNPYTKIKNYDSRLRVHTVNSEQYSLKIVGPKAAAESVSAFRQGDELRFYRTHPRRCLFCFKRNEIVDVYLGLPTLNYYYGTYDTELEITNLKTDNLKLILKGGSAKVKAEVNYLEIDSMGTKLELDSNGQTAKQANIFLDGVAQLQAPNFPVENMGLIILSPEASAEVNVSKTLKTYISPKAKWHNTGTAPEEKIVNPIKIDSDDYRYEDLEEGYLSDIEESLVFTEWKPVDLGSGTATSTK